MLRLSIQKTLLFNRNILSIKPDSILLNRTSKNQTILKNTSRNYAIRFQSLNTDLEKVYDGPLSSQIVTLKVFSLSFGLSGFILHPLLITQASNISTTYLIASCSLAVITFLTPVIIHFMTKKYVTEIVFDPKSETYKASTIDFCLARRELNFKAGDITLLSSPSLFTTMKAKGVPLYIEPKFFSDPVHCAKLLGYSYSPLEECKLLESNGNVKKKGKGF